MGLFYYNMAYLIGDKTCFVSEYEGIAYEMELGTAGEMNVAEEWRTYSLVGMIIWGVAILARFMFMFAGCSMMCGESGMMAALPIGMGSLCCSCLVGIFGVAFTIWGSVLRFGVAGNEASELLLKDSGMFMMIMNIALYVILVAPLICFTLCACCMLCCAGLFMGAAAASE